MGQGSQQLRRARHPGHFTSEGTIRFCICLCLSKFLLDPNLQPSSVTTLLSSGPPVTSFRLNSSSSVASAPARSLITGFLAGAGFQGRSAAHLHTTLLLPLSPFFLTSYILSAHNSGNNPFFINNLSCPKNVNFKSFLFVLKGLVSTLPI